MWFYTLYDSQHWLDVEDDNLGWSRLKRCNNEKISFRLKKLKKRLSRRLEDWHWSWVNFNDFINLF